MTEATPGAISLAEESEIDLAQVAGTGSGGKVTVGDVQRAIAEREAAAVQPEEGKAPAAEPEINPFQRGPEGDLGERVTVKFVGPTHAVLSGRLILSGETREITRLQLKIAQAQRPGLFVVVGEEQPGQG
jgi:pyruvate/2-oxoglutarate dehydrogenase complex dihydrolipoamide acyltransferase (E2) component